MPWVKDVVDQRIRFVMEVRQFGLTVAEACRRYGVSRPTGYKWLQRYDAGGTPAMVDQSRAPRIVPHATPSEVVEAVVAAREDHPFWGPKKLRAFLRVRRPDLRVPAVSTIGQILKREGLVMPRRKRARTPAYTDPFVEVRAPNDGWAADFKGEFQVGCGEHCYPLTLTDGDSRYLLCCEALRSIKTAAAKPVFERVFEEFGLPRAIRTDNGSPFASSGIAGLSRLSVWWLKLGIQPERIEPGHPEQNGRHERMHLTLKQETTRPAAETIEAQQQRFDSFRDEFNAVRPHEALGQIPPAQQYRRSQRRYHPDVPDPHYPEHDLHLRVARSGQVSFAGKALWLGMALAGQVVGLKELEDDLWLVSFANKDLGFFDRSEAIAKRFQLSPIEDPGDDAKCSRV